MKIRDNYTKDVKESLAFILSVWFLLGLIAALVFLGAVVTSKDKHNEYETYNDFAVVANENFDAKQRETLAKWLYSADDLGEDGFFVEREEPVTFWDKIKEDWMACVAIIVATFEIVAFLIYAFGFDTNYYLADLPFRTFYGWFILISCFVAWPFFIVSRIRFLYFKKVREEREGSIELPEIEPIFHEDEFVTFCQNRSPLSKLIKDAEKELASLTRRVEAHVEEQIHILDLIKTTQSEISQKRADLNTLRAQVENATEDPSLTEQAAHDFSEIKSMRGVKQIYIDDTGNLIIVVRVTYEQGGVLYDIGDFDIRINNTSLTAHRIRSSGDPYYGTSFCFGARRGDIETYILNDRIVEAVELAIECLSHINDDDLGSLSQRYKVIKQN